MNQRPFGKQIQTQFDQIDRQITVWMARYGMLIMRIGLGIIFFWFGALKLVPGLSPAEELVRNTTYFVNPDWFIPVLAVWEMAIGLGLMLGKFMRLTLLLLFLQMPGTALPLLVLPDSVWTEFPYGLTLEGQYIVKNLVLIGAGLVLRGTVRGGRVVPEPEK
ncbi:DoxX family membrane protein [Candidatus Leptofilum sp.]|uniref:DoxX family membrane protein n=1 Tax=Candidatus Leptofilum sp. TaxID=3241576 RepID=UPI003B5BF475